MGLLIGSQTLNHKKLVYKLIENREIDLIIGTHTLFQENFKPYNLSYVVVDEQHRFGVNQRDELLKKQIFLIFYPCLLLLYLEA